MPAQAVADAGTSEHRRGLVPVRSVVLVYIAAGVFWIFGSGPVADRLTEMTAISRGGMEFGKGLLFVVVTALPLHAVLRRRADRLDNLEASGHDNARRLASSEDRNRLLATALAGTASAVVITGRDGTIEWVNAAFETMSGYPASAAVGSTPRLVNSGEHDQAFYRDLWDTILAGQVWRGHLVNRRSDGEQYTVSATITPIVAPDGEVQHLVAIQEDITERHRTEQQLLRSQRLDSLGTLASGIAHDLNNVLAPIMLATQSLQHPDRSGHQRDARHHRAERRTRGRDGRAGPLLRPRCRWPATRGRLRPAPRRRHPHRAHDVPQEHRDPTRTRPEPWPVRGDPTQLHQVLMNLCINARDAMPDGGTLRLSIDNRTLDEEYIARDHRAAPGAYVRVRVEDDGTGVDRGTMDRLFEPFFTTKAHGAGTGLGLSTSRGIVRSHGGFFQVYSEPGSGTAFDIYLPLAGALDSGPGVDGDQATPPRGHGELILLVDDEKLLRTVTRRTLEGAGYRVLEADDGTEAVPLFEQHAGDITAAVIDMMMPRMDGPATLEALLERRPQLPVVAVSGLTASREIAQAANLGVDHFLTKPFTSATLLTTLHGLLQR